MLVVEVKESYSAFEGLAPQECISQREALRTSVEVQCKVYLAFSAMSECAFLHAVIDY